MQRYELIVERDSEGTLKMRSENDGFCAFEILGFLDFKIEDVRRQIRNDFSPDVISRNVIVDE